MSSDQATLLATVRRLQSRVNALLALCVVLLAWVGLQVYGQYFAPPAPVRGRGLTLLDAAGIQRVIVDSQSNGQVNMSLRTPKDEVCQSLAVYGDKSATIDLQFGNLVSQSFGSAPFSHVTLQSDAPSLTLTSKDGRKVTLSPDGLVDGDGKPLAVPAVTAKD